MDGVVSMDDRWPPKRQNTGKRFQSFTEGKVWAISGGAPNQPLVCLACDAVFATDAESPGTWEGWRLETQVLSVRRAWFASQGHRALLKWLKDDMGPEPGSPMIRRRPPAPRGILIDDSQSPAAPELLRDIGEDRAGLQAFSFRLTSGDHDPVNGRASTTDNGRQLVGARWLGSWFNTEVARQRPMQERYGSVWVPGQTVVSFADFAEESPPGMSRDELRSAMSAADRLVKPKTAAASVDAALDLSADEVVAATAMLALLCAKQLSPTSEFDPDNLDPWGEPNLSTYRCPHVF